MRLLNDNSNPQDPSKLYKVGNVIKSGNPTYLVVVKDGNLRNHINEEFGLVSLRDGRLQYHDGRCWFGTEKELSEAFYGYDDVLLTGEVTFSMD